MNILIRLIKEFWLPAFVAIGWTLYNYFSATQAAMNVKEIVNVFFPSFFLASWATGQFFRVQKQAKVEGSLDKITLKMSNLLENLEEKTNNIIGHVTGGNSYCYLFIASNIHQDPDVVSIVLHHSGDHVLYDVSARIVDKDKLNQSVSQNFEEQLNEATSYINYDVLMPKYCKLFKWNLGPNDSRDFDIYWTARNGSFRQQLKLRRVDGHWSQATEVIKDRVLSEPGYVLDPANQAGRNIVLFQHLNEAIPINSEGQINWKR